MNAEKPITQPALPSIKGPAKLYCYAINENPPDIVPAPSQRAWMDAYHDRHPYRCLPLSIANAHGWVVVNPVPIEVEWNGGSRVQDLTVRALKPFPDGRPLDHFCRSNFGHGIVTFHTDYMFRTEPGWDLLATAPFNSPKENCYGLTGIIETDWLPYPFTMNWRIMKPGKVLFDEDEAYCFIMPIPKQALLETQPEIHRLRDNTELFQQQEAFRVARDEFMKRVNAGDESAIKQAWQRYYFTGKHPDGTKVEGHVNKLRLKDPVDLRKPLDPPPAVVAPTGATMSLGTHSVAVQPTVQFGTLPAFVAAAAAGPPAKRWAEDSPLEWIDDAQTILNQAGRARISREGLLRPTANTKRVGSAAEAADLDFLCVEDMLDADQCARLCAAFLRLKDKVFTSDKIDPYWNNRFLWLADILLNDAEAAKIMIEAADRAREQVESFFKLKAPIYSDILQIVQWQVGMSMPPHADRANPDGRPHGMPYRDFGGITYLNDDYEGGELYLTALDVALKPKRGMFVSFTGGFHHEHAVLRVTGGNTRLTMPTFYTFDARHADAVIHPGVAAAARGEAPPVEGGCPFHRR